MMQKVTLYISGNVQRAGYRTKVVSIARVFGISGIVQNLADGRVKIIAEGEQADLDKFIQEVNIKNTLINVIGIEKEYSDPLGIFDGFFKLVGEGETDERLDTAADLLKELIGVTKNGFDRLENKQDIMIEKQDGTMGKIDDLRDDLGGKIDDLRDDLGGKIDDLRDGLGGKIDDLRDGLGGKIDQSRIETTYEIHALRDDFKSHVDARLSNVESEIAQIKAKIMLQ